LKEFINAAAAVHVTAAIDAMASCVQLLLTKLFESVSRLSLLKSSATARPVWSASMIPAWAKQLVASLAVSLLLLSVCTARYRCVRLKPVICW